MGHICRKRSIVPNSGFSSWGLIRALSPMDPWACPARYVFGDVRGNPGDRLDMAWTSFGVLAPGRGRYQKECLGHICRKRSIVPNSGFSSWGFIRALSPMDPWACPHDMCLGTSNGLPETGWIWPRHLLGVLAPDRGRYQKECLGHICRKRSIVPNSGFSSWGFIRALSPMDPWACPARYMCLGTSNGLPETGWIWPRHLLGILAPGRGRYQKECLGHICRKRSIVPNSGFSSWGLIRALSPMDPWAFPARYVFGDVKWTPGDRLDMARTSFGGFSSWSWTLPEGMFGPYLPKKVNSAK